MDLTVILLTLIALIAAAAFVVYLRRQDSGDDDVRMTKITDTVERLAELQSEQGGRLMQTNERLDVLTKNLGESLSKQTEKTGETLKELHERLAVIDTAQKNLTDLSQQVVGLQDILSNKQARGAFGEFRLNDLVQDALPSGAYDLQASLSNGSRVDCLIKLPNPPGSISIDSKFPLESYRALHVAESESEKKQARQSFKTDVLKHVKDIQEKYIVPGETADWAVMFVPSETIYAEAHDKFPNVIEEAHRRRVAVVSPTTLMATLTTVRAILKDAEMSEKAGLIQIEVHKLLEDVARLDERVGKLQTHFRQAGEDIEKISVSTGKIVSRGEKIENVQLGEEPPAEELAPPAERNEKAG